MPLTLSHAQAAAVKWQAYCCASQPLHGTLSYTHLHAHTQALHCWHMAATLHSQPSPTSEPCQAPGVLYQTPTYTPQPQ
jgi:hypothetical protein